MNILPVKSRAVTVAGAAAAVAILLFPWRSPAAEAASTTTVPMSERIAILHRSYPDLIYSVTNNTARLMNNRTLVLDDGRTKSHLDKRRSGDIEDQLSQIYPVGRCYRGRTRDFAAGLIRNEAFLMAAYGKNKYQVELTSETIDWFGTNVRFSTRHGAASALRRVLAELKKLPPEQLELLKMPKRSLEWVKWPLTERMDVHAFGIAIDLNPAYGNHWHRAGAKTGKLRRYRNRFTPEIIAAFEKHGFIWGGKWYRFTNNHFEYRPELIAIGNLALKRGCEKPPKPTGKAQKPALFKR